MPEEIQDIKERITPILLQAGVLRSSVFGSVARGEAGPNSDIDILVDLPKDKTMFDLIDLEEKLEKKLGKKVDLVTYRSVHHLLRDKIFKEQIQILPDIEWNKIAGLRNRIVHEYFDIDHLIVWNTLTQSLPVFKKAVQRLVQNT